MGPAKAPNRTLYINIQRWHSEASEWRTHRDSNTGLRLRKPQ
jgi:hypothetical protein